MEVKSENGRLTPAQKDFFASWQGQVCVVRTIKDVKAELRKHMKRKYDYQCPTCMHVIEKEQKIGSKAETILCPKCERRHMVRLISRPEEIIFRGDGWAGKEK